MSLSAEQIREDLNKLSRVALERRKYLQEKNHVTKYEVLGCRVPDQRKYLKEGAFFEVCPENISYWCDVWKKSQCHDVMSLSLYFFQNIKKDEDLLRYQNKIIALNTKIENWAHSDCLSSVIAKIREINPKEIDLILKKWNQSSKPWQQRLSLTSLYYYASQRKSFPSWTLTKKFLDRHLLSEHYYVQKAVGWTLRESEQVHKTPTREYLFKNIGQLSAYAFSASTEKVEASFKNKLKEKRQKEKK